MPLAVLGPLAGNAPPIGADLAPFHGGNFTASLPGNEEHLKQGAEWIAELVECLPCRLDLGCRQAALALSLLPGAVDLDCR
jgi:hypothetical protein